jgi:hypothetical protein
MKQQKQIQTNNTKSNNKQKIKPHNTEDQTTHEATQH